MDPRIEALRETANDSCEYSGWVDLAQGALDVIDEAVEALDAALYHAENLRLYASRIPVRDLTESGAGFAKARQTLDRLRGETAHDSAHNPDQTA